MPCFPSTMAGIRIFSAMSRGQRTIQRSDSNCDRSLVLYWPPYDESDPNAVGEDVVFVGPTLKHEGIGAVWEYIRRYMEEGADSVKMPTERLILP